METTVEDGPVELTGVLLGQEVSLALAVKQAERLLNGGLTRGSKRFVGTLLSPRTKSLP